MPKKTYRVLTAAAIEGVQYASNVVIEIDEKLASAYEKDGTLDGAKEAVDYCLKDQNITAIDHAPLALAQAKQNKQADDKQALIDAAANA